jgi:hypothetical protein
VDWTGWKVISYAWIGYGLHTIKVVLYVRDPAYLPPASQPAGLPTCLPASLSVLRD